MSRNHNIIQGYNAAKKKPILWLGYASGFASRGDASVATVYLTLWIYQHSIRQGDSNDVAKIKSGMISGISQVCALGFALIAGIIYHKFKGVGTMAILSAMAAFGYVWIFFLHVSWRSLHLDWRMSRWMRRNWNDYCEHFFDFTRISK